MSDNNAVIRNLTEVKQKMDSFIEVAQKIEGLEDKLNPPRRKLSKKVKIAVAIIVMMLLSVFNDELTGYKIIYNIYVFGVFFFGLYAGIILADKVYNWHPTVRKTDLENAISQLEEKWNELAQEVYSYKLVQPKYLHPEYLEFLIESLEYKRAATLNDALSLLDAEIRHNESIEIMSSINENNEKMHNAIIDLGEKIDISNANLRKIRKDISWAAYNTSTLRPRSYIGKAVDDVLRS